jgi:cytochrome P450
MPTPGRLPRVVPAGVEPLIVDEKVIPTGAIIGISSYTVHFDESIWGKDARSFNPARWQAGDAKELEKYLVTFSKGARQCLGINMAYAEITLTLAMLVNRFRFTVDETLTELDVNRKDYFVNAFEGTGVRAFVHEDKM